MSRSAGPDIGPQAGPGAADDDVEDLIGRLRLLYQPIVRLSDNGIVAFEVLARIEQADASWSGPEPLLAAMDAAESSMALSIAIVSRGLNEQAGQAQGDWNGLQFNFNLPLDAMLHPDLIEIAEVARAGKLAARQIVFELTERHPVHDVGALGAVVGHLQDAGYGTALDDIFPDTPNLAALMYLPFRAVKLDRSVVVEDSMARNDFIRKVVANTRSSRQWVIAEGIETPEVLRRMRALGVSHGQGFLLARPVPATALADLLAGWGEREFPG